MLHSLLVDSRFGCGCIRLLFDIPTALYFIQL